MKRVKTTGKATAGNRPAVRAEQLQLTRRRIEAALGELVRESNGVEQVTFAAVAKRAGVTEMTVYRHFPTRTELLRALWEQVNREMGPDVRMPESYAALLALHARLYAGFDHLAPYIVGTLSTAQGRELRAALNRERRKAFLGIVGEVAPGRERAHARRAAAVIQLLHSAYAWASLREQWGMSGAEAAKATRWAIEELVQSLRSKS